MRLFDSHFHIIDPRFPLTPNNGYLPDTFTCEDYLQHMQDYDLRGGAIVSGSFQAFDQRYLASALKQLGPAYVGVANLGEDVSEQEIIDLDKIGVRAVRFNLKRGGSECIDKLEIMAKRIYEICKWHIELYIDSSDLDALYNRLVNLPALSIDHLGLSRNGFRILLKLVEQGTHVKASGFGRVDFDVAQALKDIYSANPDALMFGTDLPSTRAPRAYSHDDFNLVIDTLGINAAQKVYYDNAFAFYKPKPPLYL